jgi:hypothetical protein
MQRSTRVTTSAAVAVGLTLSVTAAASASDDTADARDTTISTLAAGQSNDLLEQLVLAPVSSATIEAATAITDFYADDDRFASVEVSHDRTSVVVHWHGETPDALEAIATEAGFTVQDTEYVPGDLRSAAEQLLGTETASGEVVTTAVRPDGSGIDVMLDTSTMASARGSASSVGAVEADLAVTTGFPVAIVESATVEEASRQWDTYAMGGSRIFKWNLNTGQVGGRCSSSYAMHRHLGDGSQLWSTSTAAHCGVVGDNWAAYQGVWPNEITNALLWGAINIRAESRDFAAISTNFSNPFVYVGEYTSSSYTAIDGVANPFVGAEICYSGSLSGTVCGNVVQYADITYTLSDGLPGVTLVGNYTVNLNSLPAIGNGDSGGPGLMVAADPSGGDFVYASTIISAMTNAGTTCTGTGPEGTRRCSGTAFSTNIGDGAAIGGWQVSTLSDY